MISTLKGGIYEGEGPGDIMGMWPVSTISIPDVMCLAL